MINSTIKTGLASFGMSGRIFHAPFINHHPSFELSVILERSKTLSKETYPAAKIVTSFDLLLEEDIDLVIINTPSYLHYEMTKKALLAGKHVVVEKPFTSTVAEGEELIKLAKEKNLMLTVYHNKRLEGDALTLNKIITQELVGELKELKIQLRRYRPEIGPKKWKEERNPGAGLLFDIGSHFIDLFLHLFGKPQSIKSDLQIQRKKGQVVDYFKITFEYDTFKATMFSDMLCENNNEPTLSIKGTKGSFLKYGNDLQESQLDSGTWEWKSLGIDKKENYGTLFSNSSTIKIPTERGCYISFYDNLADVLVKGESLLVSAEEGLEVVRTIEEIINCHKHLVKQSS